MLALLHTMVWCIWPQSERLQFSARTARSTSSRCPVMQPRLQPDSTLGRCHRTNHQTPFVPTRPLAWNWLSDPCLQGTWTKNSSYSTLRATTRSCRSVPGIALAHGLRLPTWDKWRMNAVSLHPRRRTTLARWLARRADSERSAKLTTSASSQLTATTMDTGHPTPPI